MSYRGMLTKKRGGGDVNKSMMDFSVDMSSLGGVSDYQSESHEQKVKYIVNSGSFDQVLDQNNKEIDNDGLD